MCVLNPSSILANSLREISLRGCTLLPHLIRYDYSHWLSTFIYSLYICLCISLIISGYIKPNQHGLQMAIKSGFPILNKIQTSLPCNAASSAIVCSSLHYSPLPIVILCDMISSIYISYYNYTLPFHIRNILSSIRLNDGPCGHLLRANRIQHINLNLKPIHRMTRMCYITHMYR